MNENTHTHLQYVAQNPGTEQTCTGITSLILFLGGRQHLHWENIIKTLYILVLYFICTNKALLYTVTLNPTSARAALLAIYTSSLLQEQWELLCSEKFIKHLMQFSSPHTLFERCDTCLQNSTHFNCKIFNPCNKYWMFSVGESRLNGILPQCVYHGLISSSRVSTLRTKKLILEDAVIEDRAPGESSLPFYLFLLHTQNLFLTMLVFSHTWLPSASHHPCKFYREKNCCKVWVWGFILPCTNLVIFNPQILQTPWVTAIPHRILKSKIASSCKLQYLSAHIWCNYQHAFDIA